MKTQIWGCEVAWPGFMPFTRTVAIAVALWAATVAVGIAGGTRKALGESLIWILVPMLASRCGLDTKQGWRAFVLSILACLIVVGLFDVLVGAWHYVQNYVWPSAVGNP